MPTSQTLHKLDLIKKTDKVNMERLDTSVSFNGGTDLVDRSILVGSIGWGVKNQSIS